jgi:hypothetical protein
MKRLVIISLMAFVLIASAACSENGNPSSTQTVTEPDGGYVEAVAGGPAPLTPEQIEDFWAAAFDPDTVQIIVNGEVIDAPTPFTDSEAGTIMLPVAAIAEALGYTVVDEGDGEIVIGPGTLLTEGLNSYFRGREAPIELPSAPVIRDGVMFVPREFFQEILSEAVSTQEGNIHVDTIED